MRPPYGLFVLVLAYTGVRFGEVAGVRRRFVEPAGRRLMEHIEASVDWTGPEVLVFVNLHGLPVRHSTFLHRMWTPAVNADRLDVRPHDLRAPHATWLYDAGDRPWRSPRGLVTRRRRSRRSTMRGGWLGIQRRGE